MTFRAVLGWRLTLTILSLGLLTACGAAAPAQESSAAPPAEPEIPEAEVAGASDDPLQPAGDLTIFRFDPSATEARFIIGEILGGQPNTVIGVNGGVIGEILVDPSEPQASQIGVITIDATGFVTDNNLRNRAIRQFVLESDRYPLITFAPTAVAGLPDQVSVGESLSFQIIGDLTIRNVTRTVTFDASLTVVSEGEIAATATATIDRADFELSIPAVPRVAGVDEQVLLEIEFVALAN